MKYCANCGHELSDEMDFCPNCGTSSNGENNVKVDEDSFYDDEDASWYEQDVFHSVLSPLIQSFDNGIFFQKTAIIVIDVIVTSFLLSQPYAAFQLFKNHELVNLTTADKTVELISSIIWLLIAIVSFGYWMKRIDRIKHLMNPNDEFVVIPLGTYVFQWFGEWIALVLGFGGIFSIVLSLFDMHTSSFMMNMVSSFGFAGGIYALIASIVIVFVFRLIAENVRAFAAIANNTSRLRDNVITEEYEEDSSNDTYYNIIYIVCVVFTIVFMFAAMMQ